MTAPVPLPAAGSTSWLPWAAFVDANARKPGTEINAADYGMVADGAGGTGFGIAMTGTDNSAALTAAIAAAQAAGKPLVIPAGKYRLASTVTITGTLVLFGYGVTLLGDIRSKTQPVLKVVGCVEGRIEGLRIIGASWLPLAGIHFADQDSQFCTLKNVWINLCRHGVYINQPEVANRIVLDTCTLISNFIAGFWMNSYTGTTYGQSGPITLRDCALHSNGIPTGWFTSSTTYGGVTVQSAGDTAAYQLYVRGFINFTVFGGQISGSTGGGVKIASLVSFVNGSQANLISVDLEGVLETMDATTGVVYTDKATLRANAVDGAALIFSAVTGVTVSDTHLWEMEVPTVIKLSFGCQNVRIAGIDYSPWAPNDAKYVVDVYESNLGPASESWAQLCRLAYDGDLRMLTAAAWAALDDKGRARRLAHWTSGIRPAAGVNQHFDFVFGIDSGQNKYQIGYSASLTTPDWTKGVYKEYPASAGSALFFAIASTNSDFTPDGRLLFTFYDGANAAISTASSLTMGVNIAVPTPNAVYARYGRIAVPANARKVRVGFVNSANYTGLIPDHTTATGLTVWEAGGSPVAATALSQV